MIKHILKRQYDDADALRQQLSSEGITIKKLRESPRVVRLDVHDRQRAGSMLRVGVTTARAQERKLRAATKRDINAVMKRSPRGAIESVTVGAGE